MPKKTVPWTGLDVLLFFAVWFVALIMCAVFAVITERVVAPSPTATVTTKQAGHGQSIIQLIQEGKNSPVTFLVAFFAVVVVAPIIEEFLFRLLLQGWLEEKLSLFGVPCASGAAIVAVSFFFAVLHWEGDGNVNVNVHVLFYLFAATNLTSLLIVLFGFVYLKRIRNVHITRCLFGTRPFFSPQFFSHAAFCLLAVLCVQGIAITLYYWHGPNRNIAPFPIFIFSLVLGTLYSRTQNLSYCILLHAYLNVMSFTFLCL